MSYEDDLIRDYYALEPLRYGYLESLRLHRDIYEDRCTEYTLELQLRSLPDENDNALQMSFLDVKNLKIGDTDGLVKLFIEIESLKDSQLENVKFKVRESEYDTFSFVCMDFKALIK